MHESSPAILSLVHALDSLPSAPNLLALADVLKRSHLTIDDVRPWVRETEAVYHRAAIVRRDRYELLVITWKRGQGSPPHDHSGSVSAMKVIAGQAIEDTFVIGPDGYADHVCATPIAAGALTAWQDAGIHAIRNPCEDTLVTLNVYSPPLSDFRRFAIPPVHSKHRVVTSRREQPRTVVVVGGGFSGTMTAAQLLRQAEEQGARLRVVLAERRGVIGEGVAYGTPDESHLLNVPAGRMSAWPDKPADFVEWASQSIRAVDPVEFVPRAWYGRYVRDTFLNISESLQTASCEKVLDETRRVARRPEGGWIVHFARGASILADDVVLAIGHRPPDDPLAGCWHGPTARYVRDPWRPFSSSAIEPWEPVAIMGSGLTAIDTLLSLSTTGRTAPVYLISRRGLVPRVHLRPSPAAQDMSAIVTDCLGDDSGLNVRRLVRNVRKAITAGVERGLDWRSFIDGLRPHTAALWQATSPQQRQRFLRHIRPLWEVLRHRMAPEIGKQLEKWQADGLVRILPGRTEYVVSNDGGVHVYVRERGADKITPLDVAWVINCTGPSASNRAESNPAIGSLLLHGWLAADEFSLGLQTTRDGAAISASGVEVADLHVVGTLRKPALWESTAVPELRSQAEQVARRIVQKAAAPATAPHADIRRAA